MAESKRSAPSVSSALVEFFGGLVGIAIIAAVWYFGIGLIGRIGFFEGYAHGIKITQNAVAIVFVGLGTFGSIPDLYNTLVAVRSSKASEKVAAALDTLKGQTPVAEISTQAVAASLKGTKVGDDQLTRLVEQRKQQLLIDDDYFRDELRLLIVDYLQPLPRNAKRLLNRFRVSLLVAHSRGLLTTDPKVTTQQIGKWLVLVERWPQLGRSLSAAPDKMTVLEEQSRKPAPPPPPPDAQLDPFMESIKSLAAVYVGDEDLRRFTNSSPTLATILSRLVHYGATSSVVAPEQRQS